MGLSPCGARNVEYSLCPTAEEETGIAPNVPTMLLPLMPYALAPGLAPGDPGMLSIG